MTKERNSSKKYVLDISNADRLLLLDNLPNLHAFKNSLMTCSNSSVHLYDAVLVSSDDLENSDTKEIAESLMREYDKRISEGRVNYTMTFTHIGWGENIIAFKVNSELLGMSGFLRDDKKNDRPLFVTISTYDYHDSDDISSIDRWIEIKPFSLMTTLEIKEIYNFSDD